VTSAPFPKRAAAGLLALAAALAGCSSDGGPDVREQLAQNARASAAGDTSYALPPLSRPPDFGARPEIDSDGNPVDDDGPTVFRQPEGQGQDVPARIARIPDLSDGTRAFLAKAVPAEESAAGRGASAPPPALVERLATGGDVDDAGSPATSGRKVRIERQSGWFD
jgi:hypothetical protein